MRWKWILSISVVLIVVLMVTFYAILKSYDYNNLKPIIVEAVKNATGRDLVLGGNIELAINLTPALVVEDVSFQNAPWGSRPELAKIRRLEIQVAAFPLISGNIEVRRLILVEPDILFETSKTGKSNVEFETPEKELEAEPEEEATSEGKMMVSALICNEFRMENGRLTYKDGQSGQTQRMTVDRIGATAGKDCPVALEVRGGYNKKRVEVSGTFGPLTAFSDPNETSPVQLKIKYGDSTLTVKGAIKNASRAEGMGLNILAEGPSILEIAKQFDAIDVPDMGPYRVSAKLSDSGGKFMVKDLDAEVGTEDLVKVRLMGVIDDLLTFHGVKLSFGIQGNNLTNLSNILGPPLPFKGPFNISGNAVLGKTKTCQFSDLMLSLGESDLSGSLEINFSQKQPHISAVLSSAKLDLRPLLSKEVEETEISTDQLDEAEAKSGKVFPDYPLQLSILKQAEANVQIQAEHVLLQLLTLDDFDAHMILEDGCLTVNPLKFSMGSGSLNSHFALQNQDKPAEVALAIKIDQFDLGNVLNEFGVNNIIEGKLDMLIDINSEGDSIASLMAELDGKIVVVMGSGNIDNKFLNVLGADLGHSLLGLLNPFKQEAKHTELNCLVSGLDIKDGQAQISALVLDTGQVTVVGHGKVDLDTEEVDLSLRPSPKKGVGIKGIAKLSLSLGELTKTLKLGGTLANPSLTIDPTGTLLTVGKALGGMALFGPVGIGAALAGGKFFGKNPCVSAIESAKNGAAASSDKQTEDKDGVVDNAKTTDNIYQ